MKWKLLLLIIALVGCTMTSCGAKQDQTTTPNGSAIPNPTTEMYVSQTEVSEEQPEEETGIKEEDSLTEPEMSKAFEVNENNPYAMYTETFSGCYLYDVYEANTGSEADGDWFMEESEKFFYHEQYDPLNNEHLNFEWDINLSEMKGTDPLSESFNNYHQQLFEEQKVLMEEHQKEVMEMKPEEIEDHWLSIRFSMNISTKASFKWGNIFTVVDMKNMHDRGCFPIVANFNSVSGKQYGLEDLFCVENYMEKLPEFIDEIPMSGGFSEQLSFMMGNQGLLLIDDAWSPVFDLPFIEWEKLEDILKPEIWEIINSGRVPESAYQEFLNGQREIFIEKEDEGLLEYIFEDTDCASVSMEDILKKLEVNFYLEEYNNDHRIETIEYAYIDSYNDGNKELAVKFTFHCGVEHISIVFIIVYEEDVLYLRHVLDSWNRYGSDLYNYGRIINWGSGGAFTTYDGESFLGKDGRAQIIYEAVYEWGPYEPELFGQVFGLNGSNMVPCIREMEYRISDKEYVHLQKLEKDDMQEMLGENLTQEDIDRKWDEFCKLYEERNGKLSTQEEIDEQIRKRREELGISANWVVTMKPDWKLVENPAYIQHVKGVELTQNRKKRDLENPSTLNSKWIICKKLETSYPEQNITQCFELSLEWQSAIEYAISDYLKKDPVSQSRDWSLVKVISYGDHLFAVTVRGENEREICLLITDDAINLEMPEYTEYIVAVDFVPDDKGKISWDFLGSYDSMLDWNSYEQHVSNQKDNPYHILGSDNVVFMYDFEISGKYAMNQYLMDCGADLSEEWIFDKNAVCPINEGRMGIVRYYSDDQEIVMVLDDKNKTFSILKGLGE